MHPKSLYQRDTSQRALEEIKERLQKHLKHLQNSRHQPGKTPKIANEVENQALAKRIPKLILLRKNIFQSDFKLSEDCFELVQCQAVLPVFEPVKRLMRQTGALGELSVGKITAPLSQESCQIPVKVTFHEAKRDKWRVTYA